jgi:drug/metabolite transporter (DMT)-like permease
MRSRRLCLASHLNLSRESPALTARLDLRLALLMTVPPLLWAGNAVIGRYAADLISPLLLNMLRWIGAGLILAPLGWRIFAVPDSRARIRAHLPYVLLLALLGVGAFNALQYTALETSTAINATLILASAPVFSLLIGAAFYGQRIRPHDLVSAALSLSGVLLVLSGGRPSQLLDLQLLPGDLLMLIGTVGWAFYTWMLSRPPATLRPAGATEWNWAEFLFLQIVVGAAWASLAAAGQAVAAPAGLGSPSWGWPLAGVLLYVMIFPSLVAYRAWGLGVARAGPTLAAFFANLAPLFAALMSATLLGEAPGWHHAAAFALIIAGIVVSTRGAASGATQGRKPAR